MLRPAPRFDRFRNSPGAIRFRLRNPNPWSALLARDAIPIAVEVLVLFVEPQGSAAEVEDVANVHDVLAELRNIGGSAGVTSGCSSL
jgi:hypothetical protein